jgi:hypothetical protein
VSKLASGRPEQEFFFDGKTKTIRTNAYKTLALNLKSNGGARGVQISGVNSNTYQLWKMEGDRFVSVHNNYNLEVVGNKD